MIPISTLIEKATENIPGWSPQDQLFSLFTLAFSSANIEGDILELGAWCGRSAVALGMAVNLIGNSKVYCVDLFPEKNDWYKNDDGSYSFSVTIDGKIFGAYSEQTVWVEPFEKDILPVYDIFSSTLNAFNETMAINSLGGVVTPFKGDLEFFSSKVAPGFKIRMAFIDGDHSYDSVAKDIAIVREFLVPGGWICFDDAFSTYKGVDQAIEEFVINSGLFHQCQQLTRKLFVARYLG